MMIPTSGGSATCLVPPEIARTAVVAAMAAKGKRRRFRVVSQLDFSVPHFRLGPRGSRSRRNSIDLGKNAPLEAKVAIHDTENHIKKHPGMIINVTEII
jgi:hypothetical protein